MSQETSLVISFGNQPTTPTPTPTPTQLVMRLFYGATAEVTDTFRALENEEVRVGFWR
ncbi:hypothetical protein PI124_g6243 [Phytophthora idaei]|nr:hypothetical protein PI124_g6243 [Phytophthora idaei]